MNFQIESTTISQTLIYLKAARAQATWKRRRKVCVCKGNPARARKTLCYRFYRLDDPNASTAAHPLCLQTEYCIRLHCIL